jgi:hypothetical protein
MGTSLSFARVFDACKHAKSTRNPILFLMAKSIRKSAKVQIEKTTRNGEDWEACSVGSGRFSA